MPAIKRSKNRQILKWTFAKYEQKHKETEKETKNGQEGTRNQETKKHISKETKKQRGRGKETKKHRNKETLKQ